MQKMWIIYLCTAMAMPMAVQSREGTSATNSMSSIEILAFTVEQYLDGAMIIWKVRHNDDVEMYFLEHSRNRLDWTVIAEAEPLFGEDIDAQDFFHSNVEQGTHYYRLKVLFFTGQEEVTKALIYQVNIDTDGGFSDISHTGVSYGSTGSLQGDNEQDESEYEIRDAEGTVVLTLPVNMTVDLSFLKPGVYYIRQLQSADVKQVIKL